MQGFGAFTDQVERKGESGINDEKHAADDGKPLQCAGYGGAAEQQHARDHRQQDICNLLSPIDPPEPS